MKIAIATFGEKGSLAWDGDKFYEFGILKNYSIEKSLQIGAKVASEVVSVFEPWTTD